MSEEEEQHLLINSESADKIKYQATSGKHGYENGNGNENGKDQEKNENGTVRTWRVKQGEDEEDKENDGPSLSKTQSIFFAIAQLGLAFIFGVSGGWLAFYYLPPESEGEQLIDPTVYSLTILIGRIFNGFCEPWIGYFSDRLESRFGRRRPFIFVATPLMALTFGMLWFMPFENKSLGASLWFTCLFILHNFFSACMLAPYVSLIPEICKSKRDRVSLSANMGIWGILGNILVGLVGPIDNWLADGVEFLGYTLSGIQVLVCAMCVVLVITCWIPCLVVTEQPVDRSKISDFSMINELRTAFSNYSFRTFIGMLSLYITGITMFQATFPFVATVVLETEEGLVKPGNGETWVGVMALITLIGALLSVPLVAWGSRRFGKRLVIVISGTVSTVGVSLLFGIQYMRDPAIGLLVIMTAASIPIGAFFILPNAIFADVVDEDEKATGIKREGVYTGVRMLIIRTTSGIGSFLIIPLLMLGDTPEDPLGIMVTYLVIGAILLGSTLIFSKHPIKM